MKKLNIIVACLVTALALGGSASAGDRDSDVVRLAEAKDRLANGAGSVKPNQAIRMRAEAADLQKLLDAAESGKTIDPAEIDRAIDRSYRGY